AWSPGLQKPLEAPVVYLDARDSAGLEKYKGKLKGVIVLSGSPRELQARFDPLASRMADSDLARLANAQPGANMLLGQPRDQTASERRALFEASGATGEALVNRRRTMGDGMNLGANPATQPGTQPTSRPGLRRGFDPFA